VGQETREQLHKKVSQTCAKNGGGDKEGSKPTVIPIKNDNACFCNITMGCVHPTTVALEKQYISLIKCVYFYTQLSSKQCACKVFYSHLQAFQLNNIIHITVFPGL
jgi:hypothetical protein